MGNGPDNGEESPEERANRELIELLNELRVALPGVQVLFAFLLGVPFTQRFTKLDELDQQLYVSAVVATAAATFFLVAPTAHHRLRFRSGVKEQLLRVANAFAIVGLVLLAYAVSAVSYVVVGMVDDSPIPQLVAAGLAALATVTWFVLPLAYRRERTPPP
jgi:hypothetical protein